MKIERIKYFLSRIGLFVPFKLLFRGFIRSGKERNFRKHSNALLAELDEAFKTINTEYFIVFGTLLGAVREQGFIQHDNDIDIGVFEQKDYQLLISALLAKKFRYYYTITDTDGRILVIKFSFKGVVVDIFVHFRDRNKIVCFDHVTKNRRQSMLDEINKTGGLTLYINRFTLFTLTQLDFSGRTVKIPDDARTYLAEAYGEDFMIPSCGWTYTDRTIRSEYELRGLYRD